MLSNADSSASRLLTRHSPDGSATAVIDPVGATIRSLQVNGTAIIQDWEANSERPFFAGATLFPWPNRIRDARWSDGALEHQLEMSEPERGTALHGLVANELFDAVRSTDSSVTLRHTVHNAPGYPFQVSLEVTYLVDNDGLTCHYRATNEGLDTVPVAIGAHPFVCIGEVDTRSLRLSSPVTKVITVDERLLPIGMEPAAGTDLDLSLSPPLANISLDHGFALDPRSDRTTRLISSVGEVVELWQSPECGWLQAFITDEFPGPHGVCSAIALEPMTAPADAFNSHTDLRWLAAGEEFSASWGLRFHPHP